jgi:hypothetical protein
MRKHNVWEWIILAIAILLMLKFLGYMMTGAILASLVLVFVGCYILSRYTEIGPFTQLPNNSALRRKTGDKKNITGYYVNGEKLAITEKGKVTKDDGTYQQKLRSGFLGLIFRHLGMVYTGIPGIGGVSGMQITQSELKFSQNEDGSLNAETVERIKYHTAIPIYIRRAISYGGIPIKGKNLVDFGIATTLMINDLDAVGTRLIEEGSFKALKGTLESSLRPEIDEMELEDVLKIRSEFNDHTKKANRDSLAGRVIEMTNNSMDHYVYGLNIHDMDIPLIQPSDKEFAKVERSEELAIARAKTTKVDFKINAQKTLAEGKAKAKVRDLMIKASGNPAMALLAEGMDALKPGATLVLGSGAVPTLPINTDPKP